MYKYPQLKFVPVGSELNTTSSPEITHSSSIDFAHISWDDEQRDSSNVNSFIISAPVTLKNQFGLTILHELCEGDENLFVSEPMSVWISHDFIRAELEFSSCARLQIDIGNKKKGSPAGLRQIFSMWSPSLDRDFLSIDSFDSLHHLTKKDRYLVYNANRYLLFVLDSFINQSENNFQFPENLVKIAMQKRELITNDISDMRFWFLHLVKDETGPFF